MVFHFPFEPQFIISIQNLLRAYPFLISLFSFVTLIGEPVTTVLIFGFLYWGSDKKNGLLLGFDLLFIQVGNSMIKNVFRRTRPYAADQRIECFRVPEKGYDLYDMNKQGYSFPSGHSANTAGVTTSLYKRYRHRTLLIVSIIITLLVMLSRVALGVHYPSDVLGGALIGIIAVSISVFLQKRLSMNHYVLFLLIICLPGILFCRSNDYFSTLGLLSGMIATYFFEKKYVNFTNTANRLRIFLRLLFGGIIFIGVSQLLKLPFSVAFLESGTLLALLFRSLRYAISCFLALGVYPILFRYNFFHLNDE